MPSISSNPSEPNPEARQRLFIAVSPPEAVLGHLAKVMDDLKKSADSDQKIKWTEAGQLHITLRFLGSVAAVKTEELKENLRSVKFKSFDLEVKGLGLFEKKGASVLWAGCEQNYDLSALKNNIDKALKKDFKETEELFKPHLTLARSKSPSAIKELISTGLKPRSSFEVSSFILYRSELLAQGARHIPLEKFPALAGQS